MIHGTAPKTKLPAHFACLAMLAALCLPVVAAAPAAAELVAHGPTLQLGYADKADKSDEDQEMFNGTLGWRFRFADPQARHFAGAETLASDYDVLRRKVYDIGADR